MYMYTYILSLPFILTAKHSKKKGRKTNSATASNAGRGRRRGKGNRVLTSVTTAATAEQVDLLKEVSK